MRGRGGVIDRQQQIGALGEQVGHHQIDDDQTYLVDLPAGGREEPVRPIMWVESQANFRDAAEAAGRINPDQVHLLVQAVNKLVNCTD